MKRWQRFGAGVLAAGAIVAGGVFRALPPTVGETVDGGVLVATGQRILASGDELRLAGRPVDLALDTPRGWLFAKTDNGVLPIATRPWKAGTLLKFPSGGGSLHGIAVSSDGRRVFATNADNLLCEARVAADGALAWTRSLRLPGPGGNGASYPCGVALSTDGGTAYVCLSRNNRLAVVDLAAGRVAREIPVGIAPYDVALLPDGRIAVSNWGGRRAKPGERTADSAGTPVPVDARGVAVSGSVSIVDPATGAEVAQLPTGRHPSQIAVSPDRRFLCTADANEDTVTVVDVRTRVVAATISARPDARLPVATAPNALAFSPDGKRLYVACGGANAVAVIDWPTRRVAGWLPAGWYPGALIAGENALFVANVKGIGSRGAGATAAQRSVNDVTGTIVRTAYPAARALPALTAKALDAARTADALAALPTGVASSAAPVPVPRRVGEPSVFRHVVYIVKENRTYDQVFGDLPQGNGDPALCLFPRAVTPNHHALAEQFVLLDNFYCNGVLSADGHSWVTEANVTDHLEKAFGGFTRSYTFGDDPLTYTSSGFLWDNALAHGRSFVNFGEMGYAATDPKRTFASLLPGADPTPPRYTHNIGIARLRGFSHPEYPGWNMAIPDVARAEIFVAELARYEKSGRLPNLTIIYLPSDHTSGMAAGSPTPRAYLADNDLALGRVVDALAHSRFWPQTCVFVVEDDPGGGFDHVDGHRSLCLVVSPYTRRGTVVSAFYNQTSVFHTMERMLGLPPLTRHEAASPLMTACFTERADLTPYTVRPATIPLTETVPASAARGPRLDLSSPDRADEDDLNRALWRFARRDTPYPAGFVGAHGRGLRRLGLRLDPRSVAVRDPDD